MKNLLLIFVIFFPNLNSFSQIINTSVDVSASLRVPQYICEGEEFQLTYDFSQTIEAISTIDYYYKWLSDTECNANNAVEDTSLDNNSLIWVVNGTFRKDPNNKYIIYVKPIASGVIKVSWHHKDFYPSNSCLGSKELIRSCTGTSARIIVVPKALSPSVVAEKTSSLIGQQLTLTGKGCPNSTTDYTYICRFYRALSDCEIPLDADYSDIAYSTPNTIVTSLAYETKYYFKAKCISNVCESSALSPNAEVVVGITKPIIQNSTCNKGEVDENNYDKNRADYHEYSVVTEICDKNEAGCSVSNIYNLLKADYRNSAPQWADYTFTKISSLGEKIMTYNKNIVLQPSSNCKQVNLKSPLSYPFIFSQIGKDVIPCLTNNHNYLGDPIIQTVDDNSKSISNYTLPGHTFHPGKVINSVYESNCKVYVKSIGLGNSKAFECSESLGIFLSKANKYWGSKIFENVANRLKEEYSKTY